MRRFTNLKLEVTLPYPPTVNHYLKSHGAKRFLTKKAIDYKWAVRSLRPEGFGMITTECGLEVFVYPPDKRRRDIDNVCKNLLDALQAACFVRDDGLVKELHLEMLRSVEGGRVTVRIYD